MKISNRPLILLIFANDRQAYLEKIATERQQLTELLRTENENNELSLEVDCVDYTTIDNLLKILNLQRDRLAVLHFAGHSGTDLLKLDQGEAYVKGLALKLGDCPNLKLVFLNGCNNTELVKAISEEGVPNVVGTRESVIDEVALHFSRSFFSALVSQNRSISEAVNQAKTDISARTGHHLRSLDIKSPDNEPNWAWFMESLTPNWKFIEIANPCNQLPPLPRGELPAKPFKNLYYYTEADTEIFFGRCQAILSTIQLLDSSEEPILILHGGTGVGKSSFLHAGLIPRLKAPSRQQHVHWKRYNELDHNESLLEQIFGSKDPKYIHNKLNVSSPSGLPTVLVIDQLEEIFFDQDRTRLDELLDILRVILYSEQKRPNAKIIFSLRKEWYADLLTACEEHGLNTSHYPLNPLDKTAVIEAIETIQTKRLYDHYRLRIDDPTGGSLAGQIADDLLSDKQSNIAPTLQIILSKLWLRVENNQERIWDEDLYLDEKKSGLLLEDYLNQQLRLMTENKKWGKEATESGLFLDILYQHTTPQGTAKSLTEIEYNSLYSHIYYRNDILLTLNNAYLLIEPQKGKVKNEEKETRIAHDTLAELINFRYKNSELVGQRARRILDSKVSEWKIGYKQTLDKSEMKVFQLGECGMYNWRNNSVDNKVIVLSKSALKKNKIKNILIYSTSFILLTSILLGSLFIYTRYNPETKIDENYKKYLIILSKFNENTEKFDRSILGDIDKLISSYETIIDSSLNTKYKTYKHMTLSHLYLLHGKIFYRRNIRTATLSHDTVYKYTGRSIESGNTVLRLFDNGDHEESNENHTYLILMNAYALQWCIRDKPRNESNIIKYRKKLDNYFLDLNITQNNTCLYKYIKEKNNE